MPCINVGGAPDSGAKDAVDLVGLAPSAAIERPRFHPADSVLNAEPGVDEEALSELEADGWQVRRWASLHHYFGGVSAIGRAGAAGDPRRSGVGLALGA